jgi:hypothetical protein
MSDHLQLHSTALYLEHRKGINHGDDTSVWTIVALAVTALTRGVPDQKFAPYRYIVWLLTLRGDTSPEGSYRPPVG